MKTLLLSTSVLLGALVLAPASARADIFVGVDVNAAKLVGDGSDAFNIGYGGSVRGGYALPIPILKIELGGLFRYNRWGLADMNGMAVDGSLTATDIMVGGRAGIAFLIKPWVQFFIGYGHLSAEAAGQSNGQGGTAVLIGGGLDLISVSVISLGVHVDWNKDVIDTMGSTQIGSSWVAFGGNLTLTF